MSYLNNHTNKNNIPQLSPLNSAQVKNRAGGYVHEITHWDQLARFLILGTMGATYYASEREMTFENLNVLDKCLDEDGVRAVAMATKVSVEGRAPKNDQAILILAKASVHKFSHVRVAAFDAVPKVCRIGTHLYQFAQFRKDLEGGWGRKMREAVGNWFNDKPADKVAYQVAKYKQREGWSARDLLRKSHPKAQTEEHNAVYGWVVSNGEAKTEALPTILGACNAIKTASTREAAKLITEHRLPREVVPTELLGNVIIWDALLQDMPMTAMIRNLGKMSSIGLLKQNSSRIKKVVEMLNNEEAVRKARIHPMNVLTAMMTYKQGKGIRGSLNWNVNQDILSALEDTFYLSFGNVEPTGMRTIIGLDISGSMTQGEAEVYCSSSNGLMGIPGLSPRIAAAALSMTTIRTEKVNCYTMGFSDSFVDLGINRKDSLQAAMRKAQGRFGTTDCSVPMNWAMKNKIEADTFVIYTDNETYAGRTHPSQALKKYRKEMGINAKMIVCGMTATNCSIADPNDPGMLDIAGFDSATPRLISEFARS